MACRVIGIRGGNAPTIRFRGDPTGGIIRIRLARAVGVGDFFKLVAVCVAVVCNLPATIGEARFVSNRIVAKVHRSTQRIRVASARWSELFIKNERP